MMCRRNEASSEWWVGRDGEVGGSCDEAGRGQQGSGQG